MNANETDRFLTTEEACALLKTSRWSLYRLRKDGTIRVYMRIGKRGQIRYSFRELCQALLVSDEDVWRLHQEEVKARKAKRAMKKEKQNAIA